MSDPHRDAAAEGLNAAAFLASTISWTIGGVAVSVVVALLVVAYLLTVTGRLTVDIGLGRRIRPLTAPSRRIDAPPETVFDQLAAPYLLDSPPRALREKVTVLDRSSELVVAAHRTRVGPMTTVTVEAVSFERPNRIGFRLLRGPVPHVREWFELRDADGGTELSYTGELGTDLWVLGRLWGWAVAREWQRTVTASMEGVAVSSEELTARRRRRPG